jgi:hypothetical protein
LLCFGAINKLTDPAAFVQTDNMADMLGMMPPSLTSRRQEDSLKEQGRYMAVALGRSQNRSSAELIKTNVSVKYASLKPLQEIKGKKLL